MRRSLAAALTAITLVGCSLGDTPTSPPMTAPAAPSNALLGSLLNPIVNPLLNLVGTVLVSCEALPEQSTSKVIGRRGGKIDIGPHSISIPAGALSRDTRITAQLPGDRASSVRLSPEGLKFNKPATLSLSYAHCRQLLPLPMRIVYTTDDLAILQLLRSRDDRRGKMVSAPLDHFSRYAVATRSNDDMDSDGGLESDMRPGSRRGGS
jgi:hypothetical protein